MNLPPPGADRRAFLTALDPDQRALAFRTYLGIARGLLGNEPLPEAMLTLLDEAVREAPADAAVDMILAALAVIAMHEAKTSAATPQEDAH